MNAAIEAKLKLATSFPSPAGLAGQIIQLAQDPAIELDRLSKAVSMDSALTAKILRTANSPLYAQRRKSENLRQALVLLGLNATLTLALSFTLVKALRTGKASGMDFSFYWRRTMLAATAARALGDALRQPHAEEYFLGGLLQDVGMLALNAAYPDLYKDAASLQRNHEALAEFEKKRIRADHAEIGAFAMQQWHLPPRICRAIERSHDKDFNSPATVDNLMDRCIALSGSVADLFIVERATRPFAETALLVERSLGLDRSAFSGVLDTIGAIIPETEALFDVEVLSRNKAETILDEAREVLLHRTLTTLEELNTLKAVAEISTSRALELEKVNQRDSLTGLYNRTYLDLAAARDFEIATQKQAPLSVAFADLDYFKRVNDTYGHQAGDRVLESVAKILRAATRESDTIARYGGEEFVLLLPATDRETARKVCERIVVAIAAATHDIGEQLIQTTISIGYATHGTEQMFTSPAELLNAADQALYTAKTQGRNQAVRFIASSGDSFGRPPLVAQG